MAFDDVQFVTAEEDPTASPTHDAQTEYEVTTADRSAIPHSANAPARGTAGGTAGDQPIAFSTVIRLR